MKLRVTIRKRVAFILIYKYHFPECHENSNTTNFMTGMRCLELLIRASTIYRYLFYIISVRYIKKKMINKMLC